VGPTVSGWDHGLPGHRKCQFESGHYGYQLESGTEEGARPIVRTRPYEIENASLSLGITGTS
jgi:hypothetical protein